MSYNKTVKYYGKVVSCEDQAPADAKHKSNKITVEFSYCDHDVVVGQSTTAEFVIVDAMTKVAQIALAQYSKDGVRHFVVPREKLSVLQGDELDIFEYAMSGLGGWGSLTEGYIFPPGPTTPLILRVKKT